MVAKLRKRNQKNKKKLKKGIRKKEDIIKQFFLFVCFFINIYVRMPLI